MKISSAQLFMAAINLIGARYAPSEKIQDSDIENVIDIVKRTAEKIEDDDVDDVPNDEEIIKCIKSVFNEFGNGTTMTKTQLLNSLVLQHKYKRKVAEFMVNRAEHLKTITSNTIGIKVEYTLAKSTKERVKFHFVDEELC